MPRSRGDVNFRSLFQDFNASKFVVFTSLLIFSLLYALKLDGVLNWSWWSVFIPIWIWKGIVGKHPTILVIIMHWKPKSLWLPSYLVSQTIVITFSVCGAIIGSYVWWRRPQNRLNADEYIQYKAMLIR